MEVIIVVRRREGPGVSAYAANSWVPIGAML